MPRLIAFLFAALLMLGTTIIPAAAADPTISFEDGDPKMNAAIKTARAGLDDFFAGIESGRYSSDRASVKVAVPKTSDGGNEHIWMVDFKRDGDRLTAVVANEPAFVNGLKYGDSYSFTTDMISDWLYWRDGKIHGAYTIRVMLPQLPKADADQMREILAPLN